MTSEELEDEFRKKAKARRKRKRLLLTWAAISVVVLAGLGIAAYFAQHVSTLGADGVEISAFDLPLDEAANDMIAGFDGLLIAVTNTPGRHPFSIGSFRAKRISSVGERVRVSFDAKACEDSGVRTWETSVVLDFMLVAAGARLKADDAIVRRIHVYGLPKEFGNDQLEDNTEVSERICGSLCSSKEIVSSSQKIVGLKLTVDDNVRVSAEN